MESPTEKTTDLHNHQNLWNSHQNNMFEFIFYFINTVFSFAMQDSFIIHYYRGYSKIISYYLILVFSWNGACNYIFFKSETSLGVCIKPN